jgi:beta-glucosidase
MTGSALAVTWAHDNLPAIVLAWYPGQRGGDALAQVLFGDYNPAGRLPVTFYRSLDQLPPFTDYAMAGRTYRYFSGEPLYPFGHGLSYTRFAYSGLRLDRRRTGGSDRLEASVEVRNTGDRDGDEVVQLYVRALDPPVPMPRKQLRGFTRVSLKKGESRRVALPLSLPDDFARYDPSARAFVVDPGEYELQVGASSRDVRLSTRLRVD